MTDDHITSKSMNCQTSCDDWTAALKAWGESRDWRPLPMRRPLQKFRAWARRERHVKVGCGIAADRAFVTAYATLRKASAEERMACTDHAAVKRLVGEQKQEEEQAKCAADERARNALLGRADLPGWLLLAGENTDIVRKGTLDDIKQALATLPHSDYPRDGYTGRMGWGVLAPQLEGEESTAEAAGGWCNHDLIFQTNGSLPLA